MDKTSTANIRQNVKQATVTKPVRNYRAAVFQIYITLATIAFLVLTITASFINYFPLDLKITLAIQQFHVGWFSSLMQILTFIGNPIPSTLLTGLVVISLFLIGLRWEAVVSLFSVASTTAIATALKIIVNRPRPSADLVSVLSPLSNPSFPSGHVLYYIAMFGFLIFLIYTLEKRSRLRTSLIFLLAVLIILIAPSRIYEGQHWASDTLGSYLIGSIWLTVVIYFYRWGKPRFFIKQPIAPEKK